MLLYKDFEILFSNPVIMEQLNKAQENNNANDYNDAVDDVFS